MTAVDRSVGRAFQTIDDAWSSSIYDGPFLQSPPPASGLPAMNLVFVQSRDGNTEADDPAAFGGGDIDKHFLYEGLTRVDADAVIVGARTVARGNLVFSVWHPELARLRTARGRARHPLQVILTASGDLPIETGLLFNTPELRVLILTSGRTVDALRPRIAGRSWIEIASSGPSSDLVVHARALRQRFGVERASAVGGRTAATALLDAGLIQDVYLTTGTAFGGRPGTPFYMGDAAPRLELIQRKLGRGAAAGVTFEHLVVGPRTDADRRGDASREAGPGSPSRT